jgi:tRNA(Ile)-lysidine synthase
LLAMTELAPARGWRLLAAHVDHGLDPGSTGRAAAAAALAARLGVEFRLLRALPGGAVDQLRHGREAAARRARYDLLEALRREASARWLLTAHQADDQAETVLLRLLLGSGIAGLGGMRARRGAVVRPLLALSRATLRAAVTAAGLSPVEDPTNQDLAVPRNRLRHALLPALGGEIVATPALALGAAAARARATIERRVAELLPALASSSALAEASAAPALEWEPNPTSAPSCSLPLAALRRLPPELLPWALALLHRRAERPYPPRRRAVAELRRQLAAGQRIACPCGGGWCWRSDADGALSLRPPAAAATPAFA